MLPDSNNITVANIFSLCALHFDVLTLQHCGAIKYKYFHVEKRKTKIHQYNSILFGRLIRI